MTGPQLTLDRYTPAGEVERIRSRAERLVEIHGKPTLEMPDDA